MNSSDEYKGLKDYTFLLASLWILLAVPWIKRMDGSTPLKVGILLVVICLLFSARRLIRHEWLAAKLASLHVKMWHLYMVVAILYFLFAIIS
ncbi:hypothetical protein [Sporosarcina gallistercoris]|uniref:Uncharacterized protein n=1 Tax=Sporosarcina gallistercoris TaxID=2762245 RepID=A0ABR8PJ69_9BACL|nr:hypothetical protein [Sporosarcina gallistercoris]MBD7908124.1 hypothetical protein [Sporosarcina gallistercoris]